MVNPQLEATGIKNSVLEPMGGCHTVVMSVAIAKGIRVKDRVTGLVCESDEDFVDAIRFGLQSPQVCAEIGQQAKVYVQGNFSWESYASQITGTVTS